MMNVFPVPEADPPEFRNEILPTRRDKSRPLFECFPADLQGVGDGRQRRFGVRRLREKFGEIFGDLLQSIAVPRGQDNERRGV